MKQSLIALSALVAVSAMAMAHGPPSALDFSLMAQVNSSPSGNDNGILSNGGGSGGITQAPGLVGAHGAPPNERMLN